MDGTQFSQLMKRFDHLEQKYDNAAKEITDIKNCVVGNEPFGQKGLIKEVADIKRYISKAKADRNKLAGALAVISGVFVGIIELIKYYFSKH